MTVVEHIPLFIEKEGSSNDLPWGDASDHKKTAIFRHDSILLIRSSYLWYWWECDL